MQKFAQKVQVGKAEHAQVAQITQKAKKVAQKLQMNLQKLFAEFPIPLKKPGKRQKAEICAQVAEAEPAQMAENAEEVAEKHKFA